MSVATEKIVNVSVAMIITEQANKIKELEAKNVELVKELELYTDKIFELEKHNEMLAHQLKYAESILTEVQADKYKLREKLAVAVEALEFYGDRMSYSLDDYNGISGEMRSRVVLYGDSVEINDVSSHAGRRAIAALEKIKGASNE